MQPSWAQAVDEPRFAQRRICVNFPPCQITCQITSQIHRISRSMSSAPASPVRKPPGRSRSKASASILHEMRPVKSTPVHQSGDFAELVCSNSFRADDAQTSAIGILASRDAAARFADHDGGRSPSSAGGRRARRRSHRALRRYVTQEIAACPLIEIARGEIEDLPPEDWDQRHHRHRPVDLAALRRGAERPDRRGRTRLLRCHRADRPSRHDRHGASLVSVALRQGGTRRLRRRLHQLSAYQKRNMRTSSPA